ncbi:PUA domain containing protein [Fervidicoccus fontis Kam940]|uniref:tRNA (cytosine(72)-C(5))-methyltransferase n=2 Tax=Fervidicoccus fontis TaxID=683846 RepID=H9ZZ73_FERFK|nr:PUA domain containing protein [Fervidicoccus fontis Kam940]
MYLKRHSDILVQRGRSFLSGGAVEVRCKGGFLRSIKAGEELVEKIEEISSSYMIRAEDVICSLAEPVENYYLRVNIMKGSREYVLSKMPHDSHASQDERFEEMINVKVRGGEKVEEMKRYVIADIKAAERVMLGSDLFMPGALKVVNGKRGEEVAVVSENGYVVGSGILDIDPSEVNPKKRGIAVRIERSPYKMVKLNSLDIFKEGYIYDQSFPSMLLIHASSPREGDVIADLTASPGGKISHAYEFTRGKAEYYAFDHTNAKVEKVEETMRRLGHENVKVYKADSRSLGKEFPWLSPSFTIVDPPCTGLGNRPRLSFSFEEEEQEVLIRLQKALLSEAIRITSPGGKIVYSTCTLTVEENEGVVEWALKNFPVCAEEPLAPYPRTKLSDFPFARFLPGYHKYPGFFFAVLKKL